MISKPALYYDAECKLCNTWLNMLRRIDKVNHIQYIPLQSEYAKTLNAKYYLDFDKTNTVIFEKEESIFIRSEAVIECISYINSSWGFVKILRIFPLKIRDGIYDTIAQNRYRWFGKAKNYCEIK